MKVLSVAEALREGITQEMRRDERVFCIGEDIAIPGGWGGAFTVTLGLEKEFKDRMINTPISENGFFPFCNQLFKIPWPIDNGCSPIIKSPTAVIVSILSPDSDIVNTLEHQHMFMNPMIVTLFSIFSIAYGSVLLLQNEQVINCQLST